MIKKQILIYVLTFFIGLFSVRAVQMENMILTTGSNVVLGKVTVCHSNPTIELAGAHVKLTLLGTPNTVVANVYTGPNGDFQVAYVQAGNYKIEVTYLGYLKIEQNFTIPTSSETQTVTLNMCTMPEPEE